MSTSSRQRRAALRQELVEPTLMLAFFAAVEREAQEELEYEAAVAEEWLANRELELQELAF